MTKEEAIRDFFDLNDCDEVEECKYNLGYFTIGENQYFVLTKEEARDVAKDFILSFNDTESEFIANICKVPAAAHLIDGCTDLYNGEEFILAFVKATCGEDHYVSEVLKTKSMHYFNEDYAFEAFGEPLEHKGYFIYKYE